MMSGMMSASGALPVVIAIIGFTLIGLGVGMSGTARFVVGSFAETGLEDASADAAMSEDAIQYVPDKTAAIKETARILLQYA